ncbi:NPCBM/NEW2 domain-containing protein [Luteolibacter pohnpeiensis]|uniref:NPCBM/NEW2 domain-containing protein n=1 Tax=Luteolibacter pohnpeiensis TaxID=454153 RepID=A0A934S6N3_9BACT|nr:NPCBM/NEW2 domain-containing protein [Luteolibacter pohnpeiensis]MBK1882240.1 NPCBM/NEW2 domain-containing protein [Luteolibacter pohnpeiensis]
MACGIIVIFFTLLVSLAGAQSPDDVGEIESSSAEALRNIQVNSAQEIDKLRQQLIAALERARQTEQAAGDTETVEAFDDEMARMAFDASPFEKPSSVAAIAKIEKVYATEFSTLDEKKQRDIVAWQSDLDQKLGALEQQFRSVDNVEAADEIASKRKELQQRSIVQKAIAAVATFQPASDQPPEPTPQPPSNKPWRYLTHVKWAKIEGGNYFKAMIEQPPAITVKGKRYRESQILYCHPPGRIEYQFDEPITGFQATACLEERSIKGSVTFTIETDEGEVFRSKTVDRRHNQEAIEINFRPTRKLILRTDENGKSEDNWAFWLVPRIR